MPGAVCPICDRPIDPAIRQIQRQPERHLIHQLQARYPGWQPEHGACPQCVFQAALQARAAHSDHSLQQELQLPFPAYLPDQAYVLPTPMRVAANPKYTGQGVTIAFLDSGFYPHPDLTRPTNRILAYVDATTPDPAERRTFGKIGVTSWHGLMTACVGAGNGFMSSGRYRGLAPRAGLVLVKTGNRRNRHITERDIGRALKWVIHHRQRHNIRIVNISLGGDHPSTGRMTDLDEKVEEAVAAGLVVVCAAGNTGERKLLPPASAPSAITVGGLDDQNSLDRPLRRLYWSSYGTGAHGAAKPELIAPAIWLAAPMLPKTTTHNEALFLWKLEGLPDDELMRQLEMPYAAKRFSKRTLSLPVGEIRAVIRSRMIEQKYIHPHYQHVDGTSMAAPIVSAIVAQMLEANPALTPTQVKALLTATAERLPDAPAERQGHGVVNGARAVAAALRLKADQDPTPVSPQRTLTFYYFDQDARQVALVGTFNHWLPYGYELQQYERGAWRLTVPAFEPGLHAYKFLIDRVRWAADPENPCRLEDGLDGFYSLIEI
ncbi:MAG: S8 family serine peptidase [Anaerolineales bacterium]|nr:S8 family serine peptidase [Anaerolineales bacterium]